MWIAYASPQPITEMMPAHDLSVKVPPRLSAGAPIVVDVLASDALSFDAASFEPPDEEATLAKIAAAIGAGLEADRLHRKG